MKIGAFAKKYGINPSAVRFYVDKAILTPKRENGQYVFDETCGEQMEKILKYKHYRFTLEEIELLFYYENLSNLKDERIVNEIIDILTQKKNLIDKEIIFMSTITKDIDKEIDYYNIFKSRETETQDTYVPLSAFDVLCCPECGGNLRLENATLETNGIKEATVKCECGYSVKIEDGIMVCPEHAIESPFRLFEIVDSVLATTSDFSPSYRGLIEKGHLRIYQQILHNCKSCHSVLVGPLTYNFILGYMNHITNGTTVVIVDPSLKKIKRMKDYLSGFGKNILFIAGDISRVPLRKDSMDLYIDDFSFDNCVVTYNMNLFEVVVPFIKNGGKVIGHIVDYSRAPKSLKNIRTDHPDFEPELLTLKKTYSSMTDAGLKILEKTNLGYPEGREKDFARQVGDEKVSLITYVAEK